MIWKINIRIIFLLLSIIATEGCGVYSFTGAAIEGKTINIRFIENNAATVVPTLAAALTDKIRQRILSQTSLAQLNNDNTDYELSGTITQYDISIAAISGNEVSSKNRLTISVNINFKNKLNEKANFSQTFTRFEDFNSNTNLQTIETQLISLICTQLADDIFNKAFVNW
jgi:hypothetical protein